MAKKKIKRVRRKKPMGRGRFYSIEPSHLVEIVEVESRGWRGQDGNGNFLRNE